MNPNKGFQITFLFLLFVPAISLAQGWRTEGNTFDKNWNFTVQVGRTVLLSEVNKDFSGTSNDMNNQSDWGFNIQLAKMLIEHVDVGFEFGISNYKGYKNWSGNVNWLNLHSTFNNNSAHFEPLPVYYDSDVTNFSIYLKYNFANFKAITRGYLNLNLYAKIAAGILFPSVEMGYKDTANYTLTGLKAPLYLKGRYPSPAKDSHFIINPAVGLNYQFTERLLFSAEASFQLIGADNLDGIHNFNNKLTPDIPYIETTPYRIPVNDLTAKFMFGMTYYFNIDNHKQIREKTNPWHTMKQQFFFSKYHKTGTKNKPNEPFKSTPQKSSKK